MPEVCISLVTHWSELFLASILISKAYLASSLIFDLNKFLVCSDSGFLTFHWAAGYGELLSDLVAMMWYKSISCIITEHLFVFNTAV